MNQHVHVSAMSALIVFLYIIVFGLLWRAASAALTAKDSPVGKAMAFIY
jgi:hypothetical protein